MHILLKNHSLMKNTSSNTLIVSIYYVWGRVCLHIILEKKSGNRQKTTKLMDNKTRKKKKKKECAARESNPGRKNGNLA